MNENMKKRFRLIGKVAAWFFGVLLVLVVLSPLWLGPVARSAANIIVPNVTGTPFKISELSINLFSGHIHVGGVVLENPEFFEEREAFTLGDLDVKLSFPSLMTDLIKIKEIAISDVYVAYISEKGTNNFDVIAANASPKQEAQPAAPAEQEAEAEAEVAQSGKKVEIDHFSLNGLSVKLAFLKIPLPSISMSDIGKESGGVSFSELWAELLAVVKKSIGAVGGAIKDLGSSIFEGAGNATQDAASLLIDTGSSIKDVGKSLKNLFK